MSTEYKTRRQNYLLTSFVGGMGRMVQITDGAHPGTEERYIVLPLDRDLLLDLARDLLDLGAGELEVERG